MTGMKHELTAKQISDVYENNAKSLNETNLIYSEYWREFISKNKNFNFKRL